MESVDPQELLRRRAAAADLDFRLDKDLVLQALLFCRLSGRVSFADALVWAAARSQAGAAVYSFDARFPDEGITVLREARSDSS